MKFSWKAFLLIPGILAAGAGCIKVDPQLGRGLVDNSLLYDTYTVEFPLTEVENRKSDALSGYSDTRITLGAIRDEYFGLSRRSSAFTLVPALDTIDLGANPKAVRFWVHFACDSISVAEPSEENILQNVYVYALTDTLRTVGVGTSTLPAHGTQRITPNIPVINGKDSLSFELLPQYAQQYIDAIRALQVRDSVLIDRSAYQDEALTAYLKQRMKEYTEKVPGIFVETDAPAGNGGRINLFTLSCLSVSDSRYARNGNVAALTVHSSWKGREKDSTFLFIPGEPLFYDEYTYLNNNNKFYQYAYNYASHEKADAKPTDILYIEGGGGVKPVIPARELREKTLAEIGKVGIASEAIINKATILLPFEKPEDYTHISLLPTMLSPTIRIRTAEGHYQFAGLTDASVSTEDQGNVDLSNLRYSPDISYHLQEILRREELDKTDEADIWLLTVHMETVQNATGSIYDNEYYQQLAYASYYNSLYGYDGYGGYGGYGYGGYGGYGYGSYSNYYNYLMMAQMIAAQSQASTTTTSELDKDRYYRGLLNGPESTSVDPLTHKRRVPTFRVTFSVPKK